MTTPLNKNYWAETESLSAETDTSHLNKTKHRDRDFTCGAETVRIGYSAEMTSNLRLLSYIWDNQLRVVVRLLRDRS